MKTLQETKQEVLDTTIGMTKDDMVELIANEKQMMAMYRLKVWENIKERNQKHKDEVLKLKKEKRLAIMIGPNIGLLLGLLTSIFV